MELTKIITFDAIKESDLIKVPRGTEIEEWIKNYNSFDGENFKAVINYVILDDRSDFLLHQSEHFVKIDPTKGLDGKSLKESIEIFKKEYIL